MSFFGLHSLLVSRQLDYSHGGVELFWKCSIVKLYYLSWFSLEISHFCGILLVIRITKLPIFKERGVRPHLLIGEWQSYGRTRRIGEILALLSEKTICYHLVNHCMVLKCKHFSYHSLVYTSPQTIQLKLQLPQLLTVSDGMKSRLLCYLCISQIDINNRCTSRSGKSHLTSFKDRQGLFIAHLIFRS